MTESEPTSPPLGDIRLTLYGGLLILVVTTTNLLVHLVIKIGLAVLQLHLAITEPRQTGLAMLEATAIAETALRAHDQPFVPTGDIQPRQLLP